MPRTFFPRLSITTEYRPCSLHSVQDGTVPAASCERAGSDGIPPDRVVRLAALAARAAPATSDPDTLHAIALVDLLWADSAGKSIGRSISYLETAVRLSGRPAPVLTDLAAAYLVRAEKTQNPRDLLEAVEAAARSLELEPDNPAATFNLALALDLLALDGEARGAWEKFRAVEPRSAWAREAGSRLRDLREAPPPPAAPGVGAPAAVVEAYVARAPQEARLLGWDQVLGEWGEAMLAGDAARAGERLRFAEAIGQALEKRGGDATLVDEVRTIRAHAADPAGTAALATAHREYSAGRRAFLARDFVRAGPAFGRALAAAGRGTPLYGWATVFSGATLGQTGYADEAERLLRGLEGSADTLRYSALAGQVGWARGMALTRDNRSEEALTALRAAGRHFERAGEPESSGAVLANAISAEYTLGDLSAMHRTMHRGLTTLRGHRGFVWLHNLLYISAGATAAGGLRRAAVELQNEGVGAAVRTESPIYVAEARLARARLSAAQGRIGFANAEVAAARPLVEGLPPGTMRNWLTADLRLTRTGTGLRGDPRRAEAALDSVVEFFAAGIPNPARLVPALIARADARLSAGRLPGAEADLERALELLDEQHAGTTSMSLRVSLLDAARGLVDRLVMLRIAAGRGGEALEILEMGRASLGPRTTRAVRNAPRAPAGHVAVEYALVGDTLLVWTVRDTTVRLTRSIVDRARLTRTIDNARSALELHADDAGVRRDLAVLYDWLVRPVRAQLGPADTPLLLVADGEIAAVPMAALYDTVRHRYLVEDHPLRFVTSLHDVGGRRPVEVRGAETILLVADPAFDVKANPGIERLPGAHAEVKAIAREYPRTELLDGAAADRPGFVARLGRAGVVHYAGHAVFDDDRPAESHLVLAPEPRATPGAARLTAAEIERLDLRGTRLVVLSACRTARGHSGRSGGFAGLAGALLGAGAGGVIGSLWRVDDDLTRLLMVEFHRAYRQSGDAAHALRAAQLQLLNSGDSQRHTPAAWGAFELLGT